MWLRCREEDEGELLSLCHRSVTGTGDFHQKPAVGGNPPPLPILLHPAFPESSK